VVVIFGGVRRAETFSLAGIDNIPYADSGHQRLLPSHPEIPASNIVGSVGTFYLIGTAWLAGRRAERTLLIDWSALFVGLAGAVAAIALGVYSLHNPGGVDKTTVPDGMSFFFAAILLLLATAGDIRMLARGGISGRRRLTRHLWHMGYGLFIATGCFFLGQQQVFPAFRRGSIFLTLAALLPLPLLIYWFLRVRFSKAYKDQLSPHPMPVTP
jgi:hypothetical protein